MHVKLKIVDISHIITVLTMMPLTERHDPILVGEVSCWTTQIKKNGEKMIKNK